MVETNVRVQQNDVLVRNANVRDVANLNKPMETAQLWGIYSKDIRRFIGARVKGSAVDDILQQVFLVVHEKYHLLKDKNATKSRIYRIAQNTIVDRYRVEYGGKNGKFDDAFWDSLEESSTSDTKQEILVRNISSCLLPMIDDLDDQTRQVMKRYLENDMTYQMIAEELGLTESNIKIIVHRAKKKLKSMYATCCNQYRDEKGRLIDSWCRSACGCDNTIIK